MRKSLYLFLAAALAFAACKKADDAKKSDDKAADTAKKDEPKKDEPKTTEPKPEDKPAAPAPATDTKPAEPAAPIAQSESKIDGDTITLGFSVAPVGTKYSEEQTQEMHMTVHASGQDVEVVGGGHSKKDWEVLAVSPEAVTKAKVTYTAYEKSQKVMGQEKEKPAPFVGKTYILEGHPPTVTTDAGAAPADEAAAVGEEEKEFGDPEKMGRLLIGKSFKKDETVDLPAAEIKSFMGDELDVSKLTMTYRGQDGDNAKFDITMVATQTTPMGALTMDMAGPVVMNPKTNELVTMTLEGKMSMTGKATAEGTMKMERTRSP